MVTFGEANYNVLPCCLKITLERSTDPRESHTGFSVVSAYHGVGDLGRGNKRVVYPPKSPVSFLPWVWWLA